MPNDVTSIKPVWVGYLQIGIWIVSVITGFLIPPGFVDNSSLIHAAQFLSAALLLLFVLPIRKWDRRTDSWKWWTISVVAFILGVVLCIRYYSDLGAMTVGYDESRKVVGETYLPQAEGRKAILERERDVLLSKEDMVKLAAGATDRLWDNSVLEQRSQLIVAEFFLTLFVFSVFMISIAQSIRCGSSTNSHPDRPITLPAIVFFIVLATSTSHASIQQPSLAENVDPLTQTIVGNDTNLEAIVVEEMAKLNAVTRLHLNVKVLKHGRLFAEPDGTVTVGLDELKNMLEAGNIIQFRKMIPLLLAHEVAHEIQYDTYGANAILHTDIETKKVFECQADILAGKYMSESIFEASQADSLGIKEALELIFQIGTSERGLDVDHPSEGQRRTAVQMGMSVGMIFKFRKLIDSVGFPESVKTQCKGSIYTITQRNDIRGAESVMAWSLREARRIVGCCGSANRDLMLIKREVTNEEPGAKVAHFELAYKNIGDHTLNVDMEVQLVAVAGRDLFNTMDWLKVDSRNYIYQLRPGEEYSIIDSELTLVDLYPFSHNLIMPPMEQALVSVDCPSCKAKRLYQTTQQSDGAAASDLLKKQILIGELVAQAAHGFERFRLGPIETNGQYVMYNSSVVLPESKITRICVDTTEASYPYLTSVLYAGYVQDDERAMREKYDKIIRSANPTATVRETTVPRESDTLSSQFYFLDDGHSFLVLEEHKPKEGSPKPIYSVEILIKHF